MELSLLSEEGVPVGGGLTFKDWEERFITQAGVFI